MKNLRKLVYLVVLLLSVPAISFAWGPLGHRIVGGIAETWLTPKARAAVKRILGNETLALSGTWADFIRSDKRYDYLVPWHYINVPPALSEAEFYAYLQKDTAADVYTKINYLVAQLKNKKLTPDKQQLYLRLLVHFVGDVHQPVHAAHASDRGGNDIKLYWFNAPTNFHRLWDENLIEYQQLSYTEYIAAINFADAARRQRWQKQPVREWVYESYKITEQLYKGVKNEDKLGYQYNFDHIGQVNERLLQAGVRLAGLLNEIYER